MPAAARPDKIFAVVPAAGVGARMQTHTPKQYLKIDDRTVIEHALSPLLTTTKIAQVVVCLAQNDSYFSHLDIASNPKIKITVGGQSRAQSVLNGMFALQECAQDYDWVLVHDAARPCLSDPLLLRLLAELKNHSVGGIAATPVTDTLKKVDGNNINITIDRKKIWQAQTPQMFRYGVLKSAIMQAINQGTEVSDEAMAIELAGYKPRLITGDVANIKITTQQDLDYIRFKFAQG